MLVIHLVLEIRVSVVRVISLVALVVVGAIGVLVVRLVRPRVVAIAIRPVSPEKFVFDFPLFPIKI